MLLDVGEDGRTCFGVAERHTQLHLQTAKMYEYAPRERISLVEWEKGR